MSLQDAVRRRPKESSEIPADSPHASNASQRGEMMDISEGGCLDFLTDRTIAANKRAKARWGFFSPLVWTL